MSRLGLTLIGKHFDLRIERMKVLGEFARDMLRAMFLLNGGALAAIVAFTAEADNRAQIIRALEWPLILYCVGMVLAVLASVGAFQTQQHYSLEEQAKVDANIARCSRPRNASSIQDHELRAATEKAQGKGWQSGTVIVTLFSVFAFLWASIEAIRADLPESKPGPETTDVQPTRPERVRVDINLHDRRSECAQHGGRQVDVVVHEFGRARYPCIRADVD